MAEGAPAQHSANRVWWWSGDEWYPAYSPDGRWWFNGSEWQPANAPRRVPQPWPQPLVVLTIAWCAVLSIGPLIVVFAVRRLPPDGSLSHHEFVRFFWIYGASVLIGLLPGFVIGWRKRWSLLPAVGAIATGLVLAWYIIAALSEPLAPGEPDNDIGTGAGLAIIFFPVTALHVAPLLLGATSGALARRSRAVRA